MVYNNDDGGEFATRMLRSGVLPLSSAGVEVSNKLDAECTVVKGARCVQAKPPPLR